MAESKSEDIVKSMQELSIAKKMGAREWEGKVYYQLGSAYFSLGHFKEALEYHKLHLNIAKELGDRAGEGVAYGNLGITYKVLGNFKQGIECHKMHLSIAKELGDRSSEGIACFNLGGVSHSLRNFEQAIMYYKQCITIAKELGDRDREGRAYCHLGNVYKGMGNFTQAVEYHKLHLNIAKELGSRDAEGMAYGNLGFTYQGLGNLKQAIEYHKLHLTTAKELGDRSKEGIACFNLGVVNESLRNFEQAIEHYKACISIAKELGNRAGEVRAYCHLGNVYQGLGNFKQALEYHKLHLNVAKELGSRVGEGTAYANLGNAYQGLGNFKQAAEYHKLHLNMAKELGNKDWESKAYGNLSITYQCLGNFKQALQYHKLNLSIAKKIGNRDAEGKAYGNLGCAYYNLGNFKQAQQCWELQISIAKELGDRDGEWRNFINLGTFFFRLGDFEQAMEYTKQGLGILREVGNRDGEGSAYCRLGDVYAKLGNFKEAIKYHKQSLSIAKEVGDKAQEARVCHLLGHDYEWSGSLNEALDYYRSSVKIYGDVRALLQSEDAWKISLREVHRCAYTALWRTLVKNGETDEALCAAEKGRAQGLVDVLKEQYGVDSLPSASGEPKEMISCLLNNLTTQTVFVALDQNTIWFWLLRRGKEIICKQKEIEYECSKSLIEATLRDIGAGVRVKCEDRSMEELRDDPPSDREAAEATEKPTTSSANPLRSLYDVIIGPIADLLEGDQLIVVPDGPFCFAPYSALSESIRIRIVPSLSALQLITGASEDFHCKSGALLVGDPCLEEVTNLVGEPFWEPLPFARKEVEMIGDLLKTTPLIGRNATKGEVLRRLTSVALVHIAAHGCAETGEILLAPNPGWTSRIPEKEYYILTMSDVQAVRLRARLVVLSCCHSGRGEVKAEGVVGIARAFLCAGARSVLVSLWAIDDEATMEFMKHFYQHLADGKSASLALHQAMKSLRESEQFRSLRYWAPFVLIGDDVTIEFGEKK